MRLSLCLMGLIALAGCSAPREKAEDPKPSPVTSAPAPDTRPVLVVFGDSLSAGYGLGAGQSYPDVMQRQLENWRVVNLGISGDTTEGGLARIESGTSLKPAIAIVELGGNDGLRGMPIAASRANLEHIITEFQKSGAKVVLAGMTLPPNYGPSYVHSFEKMYKDLAAEHKVLLIPFLLSDIVTKDMRYLQPDGIHPTADGAQIVAGTVLKAIKPLLR